MKARRRYKNLEDFRKLMVEIVSSVKRNSALNNQSRLMRWVENNTHQTFIISVTILGFFYRLLAALSADGMLHPDEIYQSLEISHLITFGTGAKAAEFQNSNASIESYAASRSWTFPWLFAIFMYVGEFLGLDYHNGTLVIIRVFLALNSTLLIPVFAKLMFQLTKNKNISLYSATFIAFWFRIVEYTVRTFNNTFFLPILFYGIYRVLLAMQTKKISKQDHILWICGLGISTYNRLDLLIFIFGFFVLTYNRESFKIYFEVIKDGFLGWLFCFVIDYNYYKTVSPVPLNWFRFNFIDGGSDIFGVNPWDYYIIELIIKDGLLQFVRAAFLLLIITFIITRKYLDYPLPNKDIELIQLFHKFSAFTVFTWAVYGSVWRSITPSKLMIWLAFGGGWDPQSHKEIRFMIGGLIILICLLAIAIEIWLMLILEAVSSLYNAKSKNPKDKLTQAEIHYWFKILMGGLIILLLLSQSVQSSPNRYHLESYDDTNSAFEWVGRQDDLESVMVALLWFLSGGYTYLHAKEEIPIVNIDFVNEDPGIKDYYIRTFRYFISQHNGGEYFILPMYQISYYPPVIDELINNGWVPVKVIEGKTQIWKFA